MTAVLLIGTLDTKGHELAYVRDRLAAYGCESVLVDAGVLGEPSVAADVPRSEVAAAAGGDVAELAARADRGAAIDAMARGAEAVAARLYAEGRVSAVLGLGGSGGAVIAARAMRGLPLGVPKLLLSTVAAGDTRPYVGESDLMLAYPVVDLAGLNRLSRPVLDNAAAAIAGMAAAAAARAADGGDERPLVAATMFGITTPGVTAAREALEADGYEVVVFSANGAGGRMLERLVEAGLVDAVLDATTTELADELVGGILPAGPSRLEAAARAGVPQVVSTGALDCVNFGPLETVPEQFRGRVLHRHNAAVTLMRTTAEECAELGRRLGRKLSAATAPCTVLVPLRGFSALSGDGGPFHDPEADAALVAGLRSTLAAHVEVVELDLNVNDPLFGRALAERLREHHRNWSTTTTGEGDETRRGVAAAAPPDRAR